MDINKSGPDRKTELSISRRQFIKAGGLAGLGLAFTTPIIQTIGLKAAFAAYGENPPPPPPPPPDDKDDWDRSSLQFGATIINGTVVSAELCNVGDGDMAGPVPWWLYNNPSGGNPKDGNVIASGSVGPLASGACTTLSVDVGTIQGTYKFRSVQRPGHPPSDENPIWSD